MSAFWYIEDPLLAMTETSLKYAAWSWYGPNPMLPRYAEPVPKKPPLAASSNDSAIGTETMTLPSMETT
jgi:hypothetical protein